MNSSRPHRIVLALATLILIVSSGACGPQPIPTPTTVTTPLPTSTIAPALTPATPAGPTEMVPTQPTPVGGCTDQATFDSHVTIPTDTVFLPGEAFVKTWRVTNTGTCTWTAGYALVFAIGESMGAPPSVPLPGPVNPGSPVDLSVTLTSPTSEGTYDGRWLLRNPRGDLFRVAGTPDGTLLVRIVVAATPVTATATPAGPFTGWRGEYFDNRDLTGAPVVIRDDKEINFDWGTDAPAPGLPADHFAVRWTRTLPLEGGTYRFYALSDDGVRVWLDGDVVIDEWHDAGGATYQVERTVVSGDHTLRVEYYERTGGARIRVWWERPEAFPQWRGEYYPNPNLTGTPVLVRNDEHIDFEWGTSAPVRDLPADNFSVRWTRVLDLEAGPYRFRAVVDDGIRLWVDETLVLDDWKDGALREVTAEQTLSTGKHNLRVEYYERAGGATVQVSWENLSLYPDWKGEYWTNRNLSGDPALVQNEGKIDFNWGAGSAAAGMPVDNFSARWTRAADFDGATYRFHVLVDDGARLWVGGQLLIDEWEDGTAREVTADLALTEGLHDVRVEYYEGTGDAQIRVWWEKLR